MVSIRIASVLVVVGLLIGLSPGPSRSAEVGRPKSLPPSSSEQNQALDELRGLYKDKYAEATNASTRRVLASELLNKVPENVDDPAAHFVVLSQAREMAVQAGSVDLACEAIDNLDEGYLVDAQQMRATALSKLAAMDEHPRAARLAATYAAYYAERHAIERNFPAARRMMKVALNAAGRTKNADLVKMIVDRDRYFEQLAAGGPPSPSAPTPCGPPLDAGNRFTCREAEDRPAMVLWYGGSSRSEKAVASALHWLAQHQLPDGSWSLGDYNKMCKAPTCSGPGTHRADSGATALGLLPFLAAGQNHKTKGPYQQTVYKGLYWLMQHQDRDGNLAKGSGQPMYSHGLASIALCEAFGMSKDKMIGRAAQSAIKYIEAAQHPRTGGWRYTPGQEGDTSVLGWQVMALDAARAAGLKVAPEAFQGARRWLASCSSGPAGGLFCYTPGGGATPTMTAASLLCLQHTGSKPDDPQVQEGMRLLSRHLPDPGARNVYYWYYATQAMHNMLGSEWNDWNPRMRDILIKMQVTKGCATGSWDPDLPTKDCWGDAGGRLMTTSLSALTLEVYYRHPPLYPSRLKFPAIAAEDSRRKPAESEKAE